MHMFSNNSEHEAMQSVFSLVLSLYRTEIYPIKSGKVVCRNYYFNKMLLYLVNKAAWQSYSVKHV